MNYFICALDTIHLGIPAERTERIIPVTRVQTAVYETENQEAFISLPALFHHKDHAAPHGVVLKAGEALQPDPKDPPPSPAGAVKTVLLTPKIDVEMEIPEERIHQLPGALVGLYQYFSGACFNGQNIILILNPAKLMESIR